MREGFRISVFFWTAIMIARPLAAAEPSLTHFFPAAVERGRTSEIHLVGKIDPWPCRFWSSVHGLILTPREKAGSLAVEVPADTPAGPCLIRAFNDEGASAPVALVIADTPQTLEVEPNDDWASPQEVGGPAATVNGQHEKAGDVDSFSMDLQAGQVLVARVEAYVLAAGFDALLQVRDKAGRTMAFNHDHVTMDPFLTFTPPEDGRYVIQTMGHAYPASTDIRFAGGETCVYRLHMTTGPIVRNTWPLAITRGRSAVVDLEGWNLRECQLKVEADADHSQMPLVLSDLPECVEVDGNVSAAVPSAISGRLSAPGEEDRYIIQLPKDFTLEVSVAAGSHGSEVDPWIKVLDSADKELAANDDDGGTLECRLQWTSPAEGEYRILVGDVAHRGGPEMYYRLILASPAPSVQATTAAHACKIEAGKSVDLKASISRLHGHSTGLKLAAVGLPAGVSSAEADVPEAGGEVTVLLSAEAGTPATGAPIRLVLRETASGREHPVWYRMATSAEDNGVPQGYQQLLVNQTESIWLTVAAPPP